jgi:hypothetical protein
MEIEFIDRFKKNTQTSNLIKIQPVEAELFHTNRRKDGQTDMTKLIVAICNFANTPIKPSTMSLPAIERSRDQRLNGRKV